MEPPGRGCNDVLSKINELQVGSDELHEACESAFNGCGDMMYTQENRALARKCDPQVTNSSSDPPGSAGVKGRQKTACECESTCVATNPSMFRWRESIQWCELNQNNQDVARMHRHQKKCAVTIEGEPKEVDVNKYGAVMFGKSRYWRQCNPLEDDPSLKKPQPHDEWFSERDKAVGKYALGLGALAGGVAMVASSDTVSKTLRNADETISKTVLKSKDDVCAGGAYCGPDSLGEPICANGLCLNKGLEKCKGLFVNDPGLLGTGLTQEQAITLGGLYSNIGEAVWRRGGKDGDLKIEYSDELKRWLIKNKKGKIVASAKSELGRKLDTSSFTEMRTIYTTEEECKSDPQNRCYDPNGRALQIYENTYKVADNLGVGGCAVGVGSIEERDRYARMGLATRAANLVGGQALQVGTNTLRGFVSNVPVVGKEIDQRFLSGGKSGTVLPVAIGAAAIGAGTYAAGKSIKQYIDRQRRRRTLIEKVTRRLKRAEPDLDDFELEMRVEERVNRLMEEDEKEFSASGPDWAAVRDALYKLDTLDDEQKKLLHDAMLAQQLDKSRIMKDKSPNNLLENLGMTPRDAEAFLKKLE